MKTAKQREADFLRDFNALLTRHGAEFLVTDDHKGYGMHSGVAEVSMDAEWDTEGNQLAEYTAFQLPGYMTADKSNPLDMEPGPGGSRVLVVTDKSGVGGK